MYLKLEALRASLSTSRRFQVPIGIPVGMFGCLDADGGIMASVLLVNQISCDAFITGFMALLARSKKKQNHQQQQHHLKRKVT
jgi:hypothetical protein